MSYLLVTSPVKLRGITAGKPTVKEIVFDPTTVGHRKIMITLNPKCTYTSKSGEIFYRQQLNLSSQPFRSPEYFWISEKHVAENDGLIKFIEVDHAKEYEITETVEAYDNSYSAPSGSTLKMGSIIKMVDKYCTSRGDRFFTVKGRERDRLGSRELLFSPAPSSNSYYDPRKLRVIG